MESYAAGFANPFTTFTDSLLFEFFTVCKPVFLYTTNTADVSTNLAYLTLTGLSSQSSSMEPRTICAEMDDMSPRDNGYRHRSDR